MATKSNLFNDSVKKSATAELGKDKGLINPNAKTSIVSRASGSTTLNSGIYAQLKCDKASGVVTQIALQSVVNSVQHELSSADLIVNRHKLNSQLYEFTNLKANMGTIMGGLTVNSTVLVKAWEPTLQQYVLIRRPARFAPFSNLLDAYKIDDRLYLEDMGLTEELEKVKKNLNDLKEEVKDTKDELKDTEDKLEDTEDKLEDEKAENKKEEEEKDNSESEEDEDFDLLEEVTDAFNKLKNKIVSIFQGEDIPVNVTNKTNKN